jgi:homoserine acetyltransferase
MKLLFYEIVEEFEKVTIDTTEMISEVNFDYRFFGHGKEDCDNALMMLGTT